MTTPPEAAEEKDRRDGWLPGARLCPSPNHGARPDQAHVDLIVIHSISLPPGEYGGPEVEQLFCNTLDWKAHPYFEQIRGAEVSAHFFIRRDGELIQFVDVDARAWHAGVSHWQGRDHRNDDSIGIELEGLEGDTFESAQYRTLVRLCTELARRYPVAQIAGHEHIAPQRKQDPGPGFDWTRLRRELRWVHACFPECIPSDERTTQQA